MRARTAAEVLSFGDLGPVKVGGDVKGGSGGDSGEIRTGAALAGVTIGGSFVGGSNGFSGAIISGGEMGVVQIGHDVIGGIAVGGSAQFSGAIRGDTIASVAITRSLVGAAGKTSGAILAETGDLGPVTIGGDLVGGSATGSATSFQSRYIGSVGRIISVSIGGSIIAGMDTSSVSLGSNASIRAAKDLGFLDVKGSIVGSNHTLGYTPVEITAQTQALAAGAATDLVIGKITVGGRVEHALILGGYDLNLAPTNNDAQIGPVTVGGDWVASSLVAGIENSNFPNFGNAQDAKHAGGTDTGLSSTIASIAIGGQVFGTPASIHPNDHFGFVAEQIGALKIGARTFTLSAGSGDDAIILGPHPGNAQHDVTLHERSAPITILAPFQVQRATLINASTVTYTEPDGDLVKVTLSKPRLTGAGNLTRSADLEGHFKIGSILSGIDGSSIGTLFQNASIHAIVSLGALTVKGNIAGNVSADGESRVVISGREGFPRDATTDRVIGSINVGGRVEWMNILGGHGATANFPETADAQIGAVTVGGDSIASNLIAGIENDGGTVLPATRTSTSATATTPASAARAPPGSRRSRALPSRASPSAPLRAETASDSSRTRSATSSSTAPPSSSPRRAPCRSRSPPRATWPSSPSERGCTGIEKT